MMDFNNTASHIAKTVLDRLFTDPKKSTPLAIFKSPKSGQFVVVFDNTVASERWKKKRASHFIGVFTGLEARHEVEQILRSAFEDRTGSNLQ